MITFDCAAVLAEWPRLVKGAAAELFPLPPRKLQAGE